MSHLLQGDSGTQTTSNAHSFKLHTGISPEWSALTNRHLCNKMPHGTGMVANHESKDILGMMAHTSCCIVVDANEREVFTAVERVCHKNSFFVFVEMHFKSF